MRADLSISCPFPTTGICSSLTKNCCSSPRVVIELVKLARIRPMWGSSANWIEHLIANHKVYVCTIRTERVVTGQPQIWTGLPPAMLSADNPIGETGIEVCASPDSPPRSSDRYPFALLAFMQCGGPRLQLHPRVWGCKLPAHRFAIAAFATHT